MNQHFCTAESGMHHWWDKGRQDAYTLRCPAHDGLPNHNGPDDQFAMEDDDAAHQG